MGSASNSRSTMNSDSGVMTSTIIQEGPFSTVSSTWVDVEDGTTQLVVVKSSSALHKFSKEPHDIVKELRLLSSIHHCNIVPVIGSFRDEAQMVLDIYLPFLPISLFDLLASPYFSPHPFPPRAEQDDSRLTSKDNFDTISKAIMVQVLLALAFLHHEKRRIAHRDVKPQNIMFTTEGCVKLIDFGVAYKDNESEVDKNSDLWPECRGRLYFEVSTGAYRAPELLFGSRDYDPIALDLWSLGACLAEFFTSLSLYNDGFEDDYDDGDSEEDIQPLQAFIVPKSLRIGCPGSRWKRNSLFNGERGEIGLAWSIFKIFGTPTKESWPEYENLPGAKSVVFNTAPGVPLPPLLPNLPLESTDTSKQASSVVDLMSNFLVYSASARLSAERALKHSWFKGTDAPMLLPKGYSLDSEELVNIYTFEYNGKTLGELLNSKIL